jgi:hypothetical protein
VDELVLVGEIAVKEEGKAGSRLAAILQEDVGKLRRETT